MIQSDPQKYEEIRQLHMLFPQPIFRIIIGGSGTLGENTLVQGIKLLPILLIYSSIID